jgi:hypothetical protein
MRTKRFFAFFIIFHITLLAAEPFMAQALIFGTGNVSGKIRSGINDFLENDLNINVKEGLKPITEGINTLDRKGKTPEVSVRFSTPNPKPGDVITASADTFGISNVNDAYYTWYLKRGDSSGEDMREMKIDAIKAQAALHFDPLTFDQPFNGGNGNGVIDGDEWPEDQDDDGFKAPMGGGNGISRDQDNPTKDGRDYCYIYDPKSGEQYELNDGDISDEESGCPEGYVPRCMIESRELQCPVIVPGAGSSTTDNVIDIFGAGGPRFTILTQCLDTGVTPTCDEGSGRLVCQGSDGDNIYDSDKYYSCDGSTDCEDYDTVGHCCNEYDTIESCHAHEDDETCRSGSEMRAVIYDYSGGETGWHHFNKDPVPGFGPGALVLCPDSPEVTSCSGCVKHGNLDKGRQVFRNCDGTTPQSITCDLADGGTITYDIPDDGSTMIYGECESTNDNTSATINTPTPFCIKKDEETNQLWTDPNIDGCPGATVSDDSGDGPNRTATCSDDSYDLTNVYLGNVGETALCFENNMPGISTPDGMWYGYIHIGYTDVNGEQKFSVRDQLGHGDCHVLRDLAYVTTAEGTPEGDWTKLRCTNDNGPLDIWAPDVGQEVEFLLCNPGEGAGTNSFTYTFEDSMVDFYKARGCVEIGGSSNNGCNNTGDLTPELFEEITRDISPEPTKDALFSLAAALRSRGYNACPWKQPDGTYKDKINVNNVVYDVIIARLTPKVWYGPLKDNAGERTPQPCTEQCGSCAGNTEDVLKPESCEIATPEDRGCGPNQHAFLYESDGAGDGSFTSEEEFLYNLNPLTDRTTPYAINDEALVIGLGVREFTWEYQEGDEIGVVVEGMGNTATKHEDATYQTVFALPKPGCEGALEDINEYQETIKKKVVKIKTANISIDECIKKNNLFTKPGTAEFDALNVTVSASSGQDKTTQAATPSGLGIEKKITTTVAQVQGGNISNPHDLYYEWDVLCGGESLVGDENFTFTSKTKGTNLKNLTFIADFPERCFTGSTGTVEVSAKINEPRTGGGSNFGQSKTTFEIFNIADNPLKAHKTQVTSGSQYQNTNEEICTEGLDKTICRVMNNEVIAITATEMEGSAVGSEGNISWTVNGQTYTCDEKISNDCNSTHNTNIIYIPIKGRDGDLITVTALSHGVNKDQNRQQQVTRVFRITEPSVAIVPQGNTVSRKVLGVYRNLKREEFLDESANIFEITEGTTATLSADLYPKFLNDAQDTISYEWYINGTLYDTTKTIQYAPESDTVVSVKAQIAQDKQTRRALRDAFNITQSQTIPTNFTHTIELTTKQDTTLTQGVQGFFATVTTNAPEYIIFLLKITFALAVMLFIPSLVLGVGRK